MARAERRRILKETWKFGIDLKIDKNFPVQPDTDPREMVQITPLDGFRFTQEDYEIIPQLVAPLAERFAEQVAQEYNLVYVPRTTAEPVEVAEPELVENVG